MNSKAVQFRYKELGSAIGACAVAVFVQPALGQQQQPAAQADEEIVVTGSFLERPADRPQPLTVLSAEDLNLGQRQSLAETMKDMPQVQAPSAILNYNENFTSPTMTVNLRGLGPRATLVLMNGRRQTVDGNTGLDGVVAVDINNLAPSIMIERVEVLTDGASALYGSDAVAGVVNLITRNNFEGIEMKAEMASVAEIGSSDFTVGALLGSQGPDTSVVAGFEWSRMERMNSEDRFSDERLQLGLVTSFANPGTFFPVGGGAPMADPLCGDQSLAPGIKSGFFTTGPLCRMQLSLGRALVPDAEQLNGLAVATHDFSNDIQAQVEVGYAKARYQLDFGYGLPILPPAPFVPATNPGLVEENRRTGFPIRDYTIFTRIRSPAGDPATNVLQEQETFRVAGSLSGAFGDSGWDWLATATYSSNDSYALGGDTIRQRFNDALKGFGGPGCDAATGDPGQGACLWYNPFANRFDAQPGDAHYNDPILPNWLFARSAQTGAAELETLDFLVRGEIGEMAGGPTGLAIGVQNREQEFFRDFDPITEDGGFAFSTTPRQDFGGIVETDALFAELVMFPTEAVEIQLAARYEDYGTVDSTDPKVGFLWTPTERLFFRATTGTSFRQPGEVQTFGSISQGSTTTPIGGETINARGLLVGDPNLFPEESDNWTIGMTWDVTDNFTIDLNYWRIEFSNLIVPEDGQVVLLNDIADDGLVNDPRIVLLPGSPNQVCDTSLPGSNNTWDPNAPGPNPLPAGCMDGLDIEFMRLSYINQDFQNTAGLDFSFNYRFTTAASDWGIGLTGTLTDEYDLISEGIIFDGVGSHNGTNFAYPNAELAAICASTGDAGIITRE